jgi:ribosomal protein S18 acetylase RimI-like enzyme
LIDFRRDDCPSLIAYARVPIAFDVRDELDVQALSIGGAHLSSRAVLHRSVKDYDALPGNSPADWPLRFAIERWVFLVAFEKAERVGGAVVITEPDDVRAVGGRPGYAVLWDLRVAPWVRGRGIGTALLAAVEAAAKEADCRGIDVETQHNNVAACRLYVSHGYLLRAINRGAYESAPDEIQLIWAKEFS